MQDDKSFNPDSLTFRALTELPDIIALAPEWDAVLELSNCNRAFSSSKWFIATCRHHVALQPYVIIARRGESLAGILPLVLTDTAQVAAFPNYLTDYSDAIAAVDDSAAVSGLLHYALSAPNGYQQLVLSNIRRDSHCLRAMQMIEPRGWIEEPFREIVLCYYLQLPASHDAFLKTKGSRFRKRLKRLERLADKSNLAARELEPDSFPPRLLPEAFLSLHLQRQNIKSCFASAAAQSFVEEVVPALFQERMIRACALVDGDKLVAIDLYTMGSKSLCAWNGGFLAEAEHCSPGKLLINAGIKLACALRLEEFDFMRGPEAYKTSWSNKTRSIGHVELKTTNQT
ncbi:MAG: GNAT family N-acetyltransferase [Pyrinomonadaceae bacterium]|nr:GNAT family N-acetyltransferase [Pyrinomonadaceae bacterium]